jgi:hypothetical protein
MSEMQDNVKTSRHIEWFTLTAASVIALVALTSSTGKLKDQAKEVKWAASVISISVALSGLAVLAHMAKDKFVGTPVEGGLAFIIFGFWAAGMAAIMDPSHDIATTRGGAITNANLYFFSWGAFLMSFVVFVSYLRRHVGKDKFQTSSKMIQWAVLCFMSLVVMSSAARIFDDINCKNGDLDGTSFCKRTKFAVSLGVISGVIAALFIFVSPYLHDMISGITGILLFAAWCFGIGYITFGGATTAPAFNSLGNLYFSTWGSFVTSCVLAGDGVRWMVLKATGGSDEMSPEAEVKEEPHVVVERQEDEEGGNVIAE